MLPCVKVDPSGSVRGEVEQIKSDLIFSSLDSTTSSNTAAMLTTAAALQHRTVNMGHKSTVSQCRVTTVLHTCVHCGNYN